MKNKLINILIVLVLFMLPAVHAQQEWQWGKRVGIQANDIAVDQNGNTYVLWSLHGTTVIDGHTLTSNGSGDIALTSFNCDGDYRWSKVIGGSSSDGGVSIGTDTLGGVYIAGGIVSDSSLTINVSNDTIIGITKKRILLIKYDTAGIFQWLRMPEPDTLSHPLTPKSMEVFANGECYIYCLLLPGSYGDGGFIATHPYSYYGVRGSGFYALKYDRNGNCTGGTHFDMFFSGGSFQSLKSIRDPLTKNYFIGGFMSGSANPLYIDTLIFGNTLLTNFNVSGIGIGYVTSFDSTGNFRWIQTSDNGPQIVKPIVDNQGYVYITGGQANADTFAGWPLNGGPYGYPFIMKLDPDDGHAIWGTNATTDALARGRAISTTNNVVGVVGEYGRKVNWGNFEVNTVKQAFSVFFSRFNTSTSIIIGLDTVASSLYNNDFPTVLNTDKQGNFYVGGTFEGIIYVANDTLYNQSSNHDGFIAKFGADNCNCDPPAAHFSYGILLSGSSVNFTYDGSLPVDSVLWDFGDGQSGSGTSLSHVFDTAGNYTVCATAYNDCGSNTYCETVPVGTNSIGQIRGFSDLRIYPNPAAQVLHIKHSGEQIQLSVYDVLGKQVLQTQLQDQVHLLNVEALAPGVYQIEFKDKNGNRGFGRFVKR